MFFLNITLQEKIKKTNPRLNKRGHPAKLCFISVYFLLIYHLFLKSFISLSRVCIFSLKAVVFSTQFN
jgi:hypothetical protein